MVEREDFVDSLRNALDFLKWSPEQLAEHLQSKYSVEYLRDVCQGRPYREVEKHVVWVVIHGLANKLKCSIMNSELPESERVGLAARDSFVRVVKRFDLELGDINRLAGTACSRIESADSFRIQTVDLSTVDYWDSVLERIAGDLSQGQLFEGDQQGSRSFWDLAGLIDYSVPPSHTDVKPLKTNYYGTPPSECWNCHRSTEELTTTRCHCGANWNIAN